LPARAKKCSKSLAFSHKVAKNILYTQAISFIFKQKKKIFFSAKRKGGQKNPPKAENKKGAICGKAKKVKNF
jgi:hypothetical protein